MIQEPTVFILGAGASRPYGFPTGAELREKIFRELPKKINHFVQRIPQEHFIRNTKEAFENFCREFEKSTTSSIDLFLSRRPEFADTGRMAIVYAILEAEKNSKFREDVKERAQDWYSYLFERMTHTLTKQDDFQKIGDNQCTFITFNYDRSLEHFLRESMVNSFGSKHMGEIEAQLKRIPIHHVYGAINSDIPYAEPLHWNILFNCKNDIRLIQDRQSIDSGWIQKIQKEITKAKRVFFLGFQYAQENLKILGIPECFDRKNQQVLGTAWRLSDKRTEEVFRFLKQMPSDYKGPAHLISGHVVLHNDMDCRKLLEEYL